MKTMSYYSFNDKFRRTPFACNVESKALPLVVNCAGVLTSKWKFNTENPYGRHDYYFLYLKKGIMKISE